MSWFLGIGWFLGRKWHDLNVSPMQYFQTIRARREAGRDIPFPCDFVPGPAAQDSEWTYLRIHLYQVGPVPLQGATIGS